MTQDDLLYRFRLRVFAMAAELGNVRAACRAMGIHPSTYYRWQRQLDRYGPEILRPRERRPPRMPNATSPLIEQRVVAFALGHPGLRAGRIAAELARPKWGGIGSRPTGCGGCCAATACPRGRSARPGGRLCRPAGAERPAPAAGAPHLDVDHPGQLVQLDCFCIGRLAGTKGTVWQYTAIDVASAYTWAELQSRAATPRPTWTSALARGSPPTWPARLAAGAGDDRQRPGVPPATFRPTIAELGARHTLHPCRPTPDQRRVERVQQTILEECWKPAFARYLIPKQTGLGSTWNAISLLQHRPRPHRPLDPRPHPRPGPREGQDVAARQRCVATTRGQDNLGAALTAGLKARCVAGSRPRFEPVFVYAHAPAEKAQRRRLAPRHGVGEPPARTAQTSRRLAGTAGQTSASTEVTPAQARVVGWRAWLSLFSSTNTSVPRMAYSSSRRTHSCSSAAGRTRAGRAPGLSVTSTESRARWRAARCAGGRRR